jgi:hypothetical protein
VALQPWGTDVPREHERPPVIIVRMNRPSGASGAPTVCARAGCDNLLSQPGGGGAPRRYCSDECRSADRRDRHTRVDADAGEVLTLSLVQTVGDAGPVAELRVLTARLAELADAVDTALVDAEVDAVAARVASVEAVAAEHLAERQAADERHAGMAAEEAAEVAEGLAGVAGRDRDRAIAEATALAARAQEAEARAAEELDRVGRLLEVSTQDARVRIRQALAEAAERVERANARAAQVRVDADALIDAERSARVAAQGHVDAVTGERDRLVTQLGALSAELAALRARIASPASPTHETEGAPRSRAPRRSRVRRTVG